MWRSHAWAQSGHGICLLRLIGPKFRGLGMALMGINTPGVMHAHTRALMVQQSLRPASHPQG